MCHLIEEVNSLAFSDVVDTVLKINNSRRESSGGGKVTYDLRQFTMTKPRIAVRALCETLWNLDLKNWWRLDEDNASCEPDKIVRLVVIKEQLPKIRKALDKMMDNLKKTNMQSVFRSYLREVDTSSNMAGAVGLVGLIHGVMLKNDSLKNLASEKMNNMLATMNENISFIVV